MSANVRALKPLLSVFAILACLTADGPALADDSIRFPTIGTSAEQTATLLVIDNHSLPLRKNLCIYMSKPRVRKEPVLRPNRNNPDAPDWRYAIFYGTVLHDQGKFRMWYYGGGKERGEGPICYAESDDGLTWIKPKLGQMLIKGSRQNNAIALPDDRTQGVYIVKEDDDPDPNRRYKMLYENHSPELTCMSVRTATSPDGLNWTAGPELPIRDGLEPSSLYKHNNLYFVGAQFAPFNMSEGGHRGGRQGFVWISPDFKTWIAESGESFLLPEWENKQHRGLGGLYPQVHLGVAPMSMKNVLVGLTCIWDPTNPDKTDWFGPGTTFGDFALVVSNDGQHFREPVKGHIFIHRNESSADDSLAEGIHSEHVLCQGNGILNHGDKTLIYHGRWANTEKYEDIYGEIALAELPRDRWGALGLYPQVYDQVEAATEGSVWSAPVTLPQAPCTVSLNGDGVAGMRVEIANERFELLSDYSEEHAGIPALDDGLDCPVKFPNGSLAGLGGKTVRLRVHLKKGAHAEPRLYAVYLNNQNPRKHAQEKVQP